MSRKQALTLCAIVDLFLALALSIAAKMMNNIALGYVSLVLLLSAVGVLIISRRT